MSAVNYKERPAVAAFMGISKILETAGVPANIQEAIVVPNVDPLNLYSFSMFNGVLGQTEQTPVPKIVPVNGYSAENLNKEMQKFEGVAERSLRNLVVDVERKGFSIVGRMISYYVKGIEKAYRATGRATDRLASLKIAELEDIAVHLGVPRYDLRNQRKLENVGEKKRMSWSRTEVVEVVYGMGTVVEYLVPAEERLGTLPLSPNEIETITGFPREMQKDYL
jgi:hypothetical protein